MDDDQKAPQEEYSFMQEVIKDETVSPKRIKGKIFRMIRYGLLLGVVASLTFCAFHPWIEERLDTGSSQVEIPKDEEKTVEEKPKKEEAQKLEEDDYRQMIQTLNTTATAAKKCIVQLEQTTVNDEDDEKDKTQTSGVIIANNGKELLILADRMRVKQRDTLQVIFSDGKSAQAYLKKGDYNLEFGIYAVQRDEIDKESRSAIEIVSMGNSYLAKSGEPVIVIGKPFGTDEAVSFGVLSADDNVYQLADGDYSLLYTNLMGNESGSGVILNRNGELIGMLKGAKDQETSGNRIGGYGISDIKDVIELLSNGVSVPYIGIFGMDVTEELEEKGIPKGIYVKEVAADSPAMAAGIQSGDVIIGIDDKKLQNLSEYHSELMNQKEGTEVVLKGLRQGAGDEYVDINFSVTIGTKKKD